MFPLTIGYTDGEVAGRGVAQLDSALRLGRRGRRFESGRPDFLLSPLTPLGAASRSPGEQERDCHPDHEQSGDAAQAQGDGFQPSQPDCVNHNSDYHLPHDD